MRHAQAVEQFGGRVSPERRGDGHDRQQGVVVGVTIGGPDGRQQGPAGRLLVRRRPAEIEGVGAVARRIAGQAGRHPHQGFQGDGAARIARPAPIVDGGRRLHIDLAALDRRADQCARQALGHRPGALGDMGSEVGGVLLGDDAAALQHHHAGRVGSGAEAIIEGPLDGAVQGRRIPARRGNRQFGRRGPARQGRAGRGAADDIAHRLDHAAASRRIGGDARRRGRVPGDRDDVAGHLRLHLGDQGLKLGIDADQFTGLDAGRGAARARFLRRMDGAANRQGLVARRQGAMGRSRGRLGEGGGRQGEDSGEDEGAAGVFHSATLYAGPIGVNGRNPFLLPLREKVAALDLIGG
ncbi:hypothetical protein D3C72_1138090 [compost metagenome]